MKMNANINDLIKNGYKNCGELSDGTTLWIKNDPDFEDLIDAYIAKVIGVTNTLYPILYSKEIVKMIAKEIIKND